MNPSIQELFGEIDIYVFDQILRGNIAPGMRILDAGCGHGRGFDRDHRSPPGFSAARRRTIREHNTSGAPVTAGVGSVAVVGKASKLTPSADDYTETLTIVAAGSF